MLFLFASNASSLSLSIPSSTAPTPSLKEYGKLFGRISDKFILLDSSAGACCYSGCTDCEFRLPDGGYKLAEQSAARPKWVCSYAKRDFTSKEHSSKWSSIFEHDAALTQAEFIDRVEALEYAEPLGPPFVSKKAALEIDHAVIAQFWSSITTPTEETLSRRRMAFRLKQLCGEEEGLTWSTFQQKIVERQ